MSGSGGGGPWGPPPGRRPGGPIPRSGRLGRPGWTEAPGVPSGPPGAGSRRGAPGTPGAPGRSGAPEEADEKEEETPNAGAKDSKEGTGRQATGGQATGGQATGGQATGRSSKDESTDGEAGADAAAAAEKILTDVAAIEKQRDEYLTSLQQLQADFENYRKRVVRQQEEQSTRAALDLVGKLLPVLDTLDLAEAHLGAATGGSGSGSEGELNHEAEALRQVRSQLVDVLKGEGLERVDSADVAFDPVVHDAVAHTPGGDGGAGNGAGAGDDRGTGTPDPGETMVDEVLRSGYRWRGQVLRPAMVRVRG
jgi:molecular chaperone GrpE